MPNLFEHCRDEVSKAKPKIRKAAGNAHFIWASVFDFGFGSQPAERTHDYKELRASAGRRLRPARPFQGRNSKFKILNSKLRIREAACEDPLEAALRDASCGPPPPEAAARCGFIEAANS